MDNNHRGKRPSMASPDQALNSAQSHASHLARKRRNSQGRQQNTPPASNRKGNIVSKRPNKPAVRPSERMKPSSGGRTPASGYSPSQGNTGPIAGKSQPRPQQPRTTPVPISSSIKPDMGEAVDKPPQENYPPGQFPVVQAGSREKTLPSVDNAVRYSIDDIRNQDQGKRGNAPENNPSVRKEKNSKENSAESVAQDIQLDSASLPDRVEKPRKARFGDKPKKEKKPKHTWRFGKSRAEVATELEEGNYDEITSSDDLVEVQDKANLSGKDAEKIVESYDNYKVQQQVRSNGRKVEKLPRIYVVIPRKKKVFKVITSIWTVLLAISLSALTIYGYTVYKDAELGKAKDAAYAEGVKSSSTDPDITGLMKLNTDQLVRKITTAPGANFPENPSVGKFSLVGWTYPGGSQRESTAEVDFCYGAGDDQGLHGSVFFYTPDAMSTEPDWSVDTISLTQTPCKEG